MFTTTRNANARNVVSESETSVLGSKARAGELTGGTPVRCFVIYYCAGGVPTHGTRTKEDGFATHEAPSTNGRERTHTHTHTHSVAVLISIYLYACMAVPTRMAVRMVHTHHREAVGEARVESLWSETQARRQWAAVPTSHGWGHAGAGAPGGPQLRARRRR